MRKIIIQSLAIWLLSVSIPISLCLPSVEPAKPILIEDIAQPIPEPEIVVEAVTQSIDSIDSVEAVIEEETLEAEPLIEDALVIEEEPSMSREDIELIALVTMAEAEGECEEGKRLVIDTILNRVDANYLGGGTVREIVYQPNQFSAMWSSRVDRCEVTEEICQLVEEELKSRTNNDVIYFHAGKYGKYGTPMFAVGNHYFSSV